MWGYNFKMLLLKFIACTVVSNADVTHFFASIYVDKLRWIMSIFPSFHSFFYFHSH